MLCRHPILRLPERAQSATEAGHLSGGNPAAPVGRADPGGLPEKASCFFALVHIYHKPSTKGKVKSFFAKNAKYHHIYSTK